MITNRDSFKVDIPNQCGYNIRIHIAFIMESWHIYIVRSMLDTIQCYSKCYCCIIGKGWCWIKMRTFLFTLRYVQVFSFLIFYLLPNIFCCLKYKEGGGNTIAIHIQIRTYEKVLSTIVTVLFNDFVNA